MKNLKEIEEQKKILVEKYGLFMEKREKFTPISARIFATLLIDKENGSTFEELVIFLGASKSTISTNLKSLLKSGNINFFTKPGDRKKYYTLNPVGFLSRIEENLDMYKMEYQLVNEVVDFKKKANQILNDGNEKFDFSCKMPYLDYLSNTIATIEQLMDGIRIKSCKH